MASSRETQEAWGLQCGEEGCWEERQPLEMKEGRDGRDGRTAYLWEMGVYMLFPDLERQKKPLLLQMS